MVARQEIAPDVTPRGEPVRVVPDVEEPEELPRRRLKRSEFDILVGEGVFEDERLELLFGELIEMSPQKPPHSRITARLASLLILALHKRALVQSHLPIVGAEESEPEADVAVYDPQDDLTDDHPTHVHFVCEVSRSSRKRDLVTKRRLYALTLIPEYWVIDVARRVVHVLRDPADGDYRTDTPYPIGVGTALSLVVFPDVSVAIDSLFEGL